MTLLPSLSMLVTCTPRWMRMPAAAWRDWKNSEISAVTARAITRGASSMTSTSRPLPRAVAANSSPMKPAPITMTRWPGRDLVPQGLAFVERPQVAHAVEIGVGDVKQAIARAGRQHQMAVIERTA